MVCWSWVSNGTLNYQSLSLCFFPCLLSFGLHRIFQEIVINLWWFVVPASTKAELICFSLAAAKGQKLIYGSHLLPWDLVQAAAEPPESRSPEPFSQEAAACGMQHLSHSHSPWEHRAAPRAGDGKYSYFSPTRVNYRQGYYKPFYWWSLRLPWPFLVAPRNC